MPLASDHGTPEHSHAPTGNCCSRLPGCNGGCIAAIASRRSCSRQHRCHAWEHCRHHRHNAWEHCRQAGTDLAVLQPPTKHLLSNRHSPCRRVSGSSKLLRVLWGGGGGRVSGFLSPRESVGDRESQPHGTGKCAAANVLESGVRTGLGGLGREAGALRHHAAVAPGCSSTDASPKAGQRVMPIRIGGVDGVWLCDRSPTDAGQQQISVGGPKARGAERCSSNSVVRALVAGHSH